ncbi:LOW QUALITY PROTEIN: ABC transporter G family member 15-like [Herrania umbratica]|uniref:LOW QUALITY PROTEIN: ABC transporter G family member 15-like n=1 Tax=Herrania umbratica TaxID=108875 RepID=A0A6J1A3Z4_9ROSI|nr:LOW QUALITY PROTEIN: ABC transporter G family member 15-like [Herrania umbratica]
MAIELAINENKCISRLSSNVRMSGKVLCSGRSRSIGCRDISYATQEDVFLGTLTVRETLTYSAQLRLPTTLTKEDTDNIVEGTIHKMGLQDCADRVIGNWHLRGISGGEKRRLIISVEILTQPHVLFLDEPTSGLDSASALLVIQVLRNIAHDGRIVVCAIHHPRSDVFNLFDDLYLLSGGETVYFGDAQHAVKEMMPSSSGSSTNLTTSEIKARLVERYKASDNARNARKKIQEFALLEENCSTSNASKPSWSEQLRTLIRRSSLNICRDIGYYWLRIVFYILVSLSAGSFFSNIGTSNSAILLRGKFDGFIYGLMIVLSIGGLPFFSEEIKVFRRERFGGHYGEAVYVPSNFLSTLPFVAAISISSGTILYYMVNLHRGLSHYCYLCINLLCCIAVAETCMLIVTILVPNLLMAIGASAGLAVIVMMPTGIFRRALDLPRFFWYYPMYDISYVAWAVEGQCKNDMIGLEFDPPVPGEPKLKGEMIHRNTFGIKLHHSKWWDLAALASLLAVLRILFYMVLRYKERASSILHRFCATTIKHPFRTFHQGSKPS